MQEVFATRVAANRLAPGTDVIIELGGEDAKILFLTNGMEVRMNSPACSWAQGVREVAPMCPTSTSVNSAPVAIMRMVSPGFTEPSNTRM